MKKKLTAEEWWNDIVEYERTHEIAFVSPRTLLEARMIAEMDKARRPRRGAHRQGAAADLDPIRKRQHAARAFDTNPADFLRRQNLDAETPGLGDGTPGKVGAAEPHRKAEVIFDARTPASLATGSFSLDEQRMETIGCAIYCRGQ